MLPFHISSRPPTQLISWSDRRKSNSKSAYGKCEVDTQGQRLCRLVSLFCTADVYPLPCMPGFLVGPPPEMSTWPQNLRQWLLDTEEIASHQKKRKKKVVHWHVGSEDLHRISIYLAQRHKQVFGGTAASFTKKNPKPKHQNKTCLMHDSAVLT